MKRRLEIARGLLHVPRVLFLDEPTLGLDPQTRSHIWSYIEGLRRREGTTIFMTTHYMDEAEYCERMAIIDDGQIVADGSCDSRCRYCTIDIKALLKACLRCRGDLLTDTSDREHRTLTCLPLRRQRVPAPARGGVGQAHAKREREARTKGKET